jgi:hypothetical protein
MKYFFSIGLLLVTIVGMGQTHFKLETYKWCSDSVLIIYDVSGDSVEVDFVTGPGHHIWTNDRRMLPYETGSRQDILFAISSFKDQFDSLESRIKVLEGRPYIELTESVDHPNRHVWLTGSHYSIKIKDFDYSMEVQPIRKSQADSTAYNQVTY